MITDEFERHVKNNLEELNETLKSIDESLKLIAQRKVKERVEG